MVDPSHNGYVSDDQGKILNPWEIKDLLCRQKKIVCNDELIFYGKKQDSQGYLRCLAKKLVYMHSPTFNSFNSTTNAKQPWLTLTPKQFDACKRQAYYMKWQSEANKGNWEKGEFERLTKKECGLVRTSSNASFFEAPHRGDEANREKISDMMDSFSINISSSRFLNTRKQKMQSNNFYRNEYKLTILSLILTLLLIQSHVFARKEQDDDKNKYPPMGKLVDVGGYRLHINCTGKSEPSVVLIAGAGDFSFDWSLVQPAISKFARVCSYDRAGLAWSDLGPTPRTLRQEAFELHLLLEDSKIEPPYILVGHSVGGLIARVYAAEYPQEVAGMVLVDSTTEDTTLNYQGKIVRVRVGAKNRRIPAVQTIKSSPPQPPTEDDIKQAEFNRQIFGAPKIEPPFDKLSPNIQAIRLWALNNPKLSEQTDDYWAEELQAMYEARSKTPFELGNIPLIVLIGGKKDGEIPQGISAEEWKRLSEEKLKQKQELANLSRNSKVIISKKSGHHIGLEEPELVIGAIKRIIGTVKIIQK